jgi:alpha-ribazole phosphatase/probable phosphoglycerate mutase
VVTHAGVISQLLGFLQGIRAAAWEPFRPDNASLTKLEWHGESGALLSFNQRFHLPEQLRHRRS